MLRRVRQALSLYPLPDGCAVLDADGDSFASSEVRVSRHLIPGELTALRLIQNFRCDHHKHGHEFMAFWVYWDPTGLLLVKETMCEWSGFVGSDRILSFRSDLLVAEWGPTPIYVLRDGKVVKDFDCGTREQGKLP